MSSKPIVAIVGVGKIASFHVLALREAGFDVQHVAASPNSKNITNFAESHKINNKWSDPYDLISNGNWDAIVIAATVENTFELLTEAKRIGRPCLVEKPIAYSAPLIRQLLNSSTHIRVGYNRRFYETSQLAREFAKSGPCIFMLEIPERTSQNNGPGFNSLLHNSVHAFDLLSFIIGRYRIEHIISNNDKKSPGYVASVANDQGHFGVIVINMNCPSSYSLSLDRAPKRLQLKPFEFCRIYDGVEVIASSSEIPFRQYVPIKTAEFDCGNVQDGMKPGLLHQAISLYSFTTTGTWDEKAATIEDAHFAIDIANMFAAATATHALNQTEDHSL